MSVSESPLDDIQKDSWTTYITGIGLWTPNYPSTKAWASGEASSDALQPKAHELSRQTSRRASFFAKSLAVACAEACHQAEINRSEAALVFGSALGETKVMLTLLEQMLVSSDEMSPMMFAVSVHNAASGLVSISNNNRAFTTSLAADYDTPAMGLLEASLASQTWSTPAILVCGDEAAPEGLVSPEQAFAHLSLALVVECQLRDGVQPLAKLDSLSPRATHPKFIHLPPSLGRNPQAGLLHLVDAIVHQTPGTIRLDRGEGQGWSVNLTLSP